MGLSQIVFLIVALSSVFWAFVQYRRIWNTIQLGKNKKIGGFKKERWKNVLLVAFGQKKMFSRPLAAFMHLFIYVAFLLTQIELIEIFIDGLTGSHRIFAAGLGAFYSFTISFIEILSVLAFVATIIFLARRNLLKLKRFHSQEMTWWPKWDANIILFLEILLIIGIFSMNGADVLLQQLAPSQYHATGTMLISEQLGPFLFEGLSIEHLMIIERMGWWLHLLVVFAFLNYIPRSKHLHIFLAFPNVYFSSQESRGKMENMPEIMNEVKSMMGLQTENEISTVEEEIPEFGAKDVFDLDWKNLLDAFTCTECGRCTSVCPANMTGKRLSPRKIMMDIRDRAEEINKKIESGQSAYIDQDKANGSSLLSKSNFNDNKTLFDRISKEEIRACTTCNACVEACPVLINPMDPILKLRRYEILTESSGPADWIAMFTSLENSGAVWQTSDSRDHWMKNN